MHDIVSDPVRPARRLYDLARRVSDPTQLMKVAIELRLLGRPDLSLDILDSLITKRGASKENLTEKIICLHALGYVTDAQEVIALSKKLGAADFDTLQLELRVALRLKGEALSQFRFGDLLTSVRNRDDLRTLLGLLPWRSLSLRDMGQLSSIGLRYLGAGALKIPIRWVGTRLFEGCARVLVGACVGCCRIFTAQRNIYFCSLTKFTRLADLVDQMDPLLRRLHSNPDTANYKLFVFFFAGYPNQKLVVMYAKHCTFVRATNRLSRKLALYFIELLKVDGRLTEITTDYRKNNVDFLTKPPVIGFDAGEDKELRRQLQRTGIDPDRPFICFGLRDMAYYSFYGDVMKIPLTQQGKRSETYHRCPPLDTYIQFAKFWSQRGYQVVRMGLKVSQPLPKELSPLIIDYASGERSDELDAFLLARCWFLTAGDTGLFSGAAAFDRPALVSDLFLIRNTIYSSNKQVRSIFVPKLIRDGRDGQYLTFREQIYFNHFFSYHDECEAAGFEIVHNSPDDVIDASLELAERMAGTYNASREDAELQESFHRIYPPDHVGYRSTGMISTKFLKKYSHLLE